MDWEVAIIANTLDATRQGAILPTPFTDRCPVILKSQSLQLEQNTKRQRINELLGKDELTAEERAELDTITKHALEIEVEYRAAIIAEDADLEQRKSEAGDVDPEVRERVELRSKAKLTNFLTCAARGRMVDDAEAELCAAAGVTGIPIELWDVPVPEQPNGAEHRVITPAPGTVGVNLDPIRPAVFANSIAARLGIEMPRVASGTFATATVGTSQSAVALEKSGAAVATAGALTVSTAVPKRVSARLELTLEGIAAVGQSNFESILRQNLALALSDELDDQAINGDGQAPNLTGMFQRLTDPSVPGADVADFDDFVTAFADGIDGRWSLTVQEVAIVAGVAAYKLSAKTFRDRVIDTGQRGGVSLGDEAFSDYAMRQYGGWFTNKRMPAKANHIQEAILYRKGRSMMGGSCSTRTSSRSRTRPLVHVSRTIASGHRSRTSCPRGGCRTHPWACRWSRDIRRHRAGDRIGSWAGPPTP